MRFSVGILVSFLAMGAAAQSDLGLTKANSGSSFVITVTNYGPNPAGSFVVEDTMPAPAQFSPQAIPPPWFCTPATPSSSLRCTHPGPLTVGHSAVLRLRYTAGASETDFVNCARVSHVIADLDDNRGNDRDCACVDVWRCRDVVIDLTTGRANGANLPANARDDDWIYVPAAGAAAAATVATTPWAVPPPTGTPGAWIRPPNSTADGQHTYRTTFTLNESWSENQCALTLRFAADNSVAFSLDGTALTEAVTPAADRSISAAFARLTIPERISLRGGPHTLTAVVTNNGAGPTGLFVHGEVICRCMTNN